MAKVLHDSSHVAGGLSIFIMAGRELPWTSIWLRDTHARAGPAARAGLTALILGVALVLLALNESSTWLFPARDGRRRTRASGRRSRGAFRANHQPRSRPIAARRWSRRCTSPPTSPTACRRSRPASP